MRTQRTSVGTCYSEAGGRRLGREPGPCRWRCLRRSLQRRSQTYGRKRILSGEGLGGIFFLRCARTTRPTQPGAPASGAGPWVPAPRLGQVGGEGKRRGGGGGGGEESQVRVGEGKKRQQETRAETDTYSGTTCLICGFTYPSTALAAEGGKMVMRTKVDTYLCSRPPPPHSPQCHGAHQG